MFGAGPTLAQRPPREAGASGPATRPNALAVAEGSGSELFIQRDAEAVIGGAPFRYARSYAAAASYQSIGTGIVIATAPIIIFNDAPKNEHEASRLLSIGTGGGGAEAARSLVAAFGSHTGIRSKRARIEGDADLSHVSRIEFLDDVEGVLVDPEVPEEQVRFATERIAITFEGGEIASLTTDRAFTITRPRAQDLTFTGRGLDVRLLEGRARLLQDVHIEGVPPARAGSKRVPFTLDAPGPVELEFQKRQGKGAKLSLACMRAWTLGGATFAQGDLHGTGTVATLTTNERSAVEKLDLAGDVRISDSGSDARGTRLFVTPQHASVLARLEGDPVVIRPLPESALFAQAGPDATLTTSGAVTISPVQAGSDGVRGRTTRIGPGVIFDGDTGHVEAASAVLWSAADPNAEVAFRVWIEKLDALDFETSVVAEKCVIVRKGAGAEAIDHVTLTGPYDVVHRSKKSARPEDAPASQPAVPDFAGGPMRLKGPGTLEIAHPVAADRPIVVEASGGFLAEALDPKDPKAAPRGTLEAKAARLVLAPQPAAVLPGGGPSRAVESFVASGRVRVDMPGRARARGDRMTYEASLKRLVLLGGGADEAAVVERVITGSQDWLSAQSITFHQDTLRLVAIQGVNAEIALAPLPWIGDPSRANAPPVPSRLHAQRLVASLDPERYRKGEVVATEVTTEVAVRLTQRDRILTADYASLDLLRKTGQVRGAPLRYAVSRTLGGVERTEGLVCPSLTLDGNRLLVEGPAEAIVHAQRGLGVPRLADRKTPAASRRADGPFEAVNLRLGRRAVVLEDVIVAEGRVSMEQAEGTPAATIAAADEALLFLQDTRPAESGPSAREVGFIVLKGHAKYRSQDLDASSDVMQLNRGTSHAAFYNERPEKVILIMKRVVHEASVWNGVSRLDVDFSDPELAVSHRARPRLCTRARVPEGFAMTRRAGPLARGSDPARDGRRGATAGERAGYPGARRHHLHQGRRGLSDRQRPRLPRRHGAPLRDRRDLADEGRAPRRIETASAWAAHHSDRHLRRWTREGGLRRRDRPRPPEGRNPPVRERLLRLRSRARAHRRPRRALPGHDSERSEGDASPQGGRAADALRGPVRAEGRADLDVPLRQPSLPRGL